METARRQAARTPELMAAREQAVAQGTGPVARRTPGDRLAKMPFRLRVVSRRVENLSYEEVGGREESPNLPLRSSALLVELLDGHNISISAATA